MTPMDTLLHQAETRPDQVAFIAGESEWTYRHMAVESERLAWALCARGVRCRDRVALHMANVPEMVVAYYACSRIGAIAAPLNVRLKAAELQPLLQRLAPVLYLGQAELYSAIDGIDPDTIGANARFVVGAIEDGEGRRQDDQSWDTLVGGAVARAVLATPDVDAPAVLLTTSGTTGQPKFVAHTPATLSATADAFAHFGLDGGQIALSALPLVHMSGLSTFLAYMRFGVPIILQERFDADAALDAIETHRCTWLVGLPATIAELLRSQRERPRDLTSLRHCLTAGDVCPPGLQQEFAELMGIPLRSLWASTEVVGALTYGLEPGPVSRIVAGTDVCLVDDAGAQVSQGEAGELLLRSPSLAAGYWDGPGRIDALLKDGWFHTGDVMRRGDNDDLWFVSRKKELIVRGGSNISPVEVEQVLEAHPAVQAAAVVGVPDAVLGQRVVGVIELAGAASSTALDDIRASAATQLADYKLPEELHAVERIPRNAAGKIERNSLPDLAANADA